MIIRGRIKKDKYFDSVSLMQVRKEIIGWDGVRDAATVMGTGENRSILADSGLLIPEFEHAADTDLLLVVGAEETGIAEAALERAEQLLEHLRRKPSGGSAFQPGSLDGALRQMPAANLAVISVAGHWAGDEARRALQAGLHVMLFSDNVPLATEIELKELARQRGLLLMGPDCGTAIINGVPLGFANAVDPGGVGIVAAAGTGLQEVSCLISEEGAGISQSIGTGGRDIKREVGGIMFLDGLRRLAADPETRVILLVAKPPHPEVLKRITDACRAVQKPVVAAFLGAVPEELERAGLIAAVTLEESARVAAALSRETGAPRGDVVAGVRRELAGRNNPMLDIARSEAGCLASGRRYLRGLFSGGTFCAEAQLILRDLLPEMYSNTPTAGTCLLPDARRSQGHTVVDLGDDEFTVGRPHPMIDYQLRNERIRRESEDAGVGVILLDVVLGYGSHPDPASELAPVIREAAGRVAIVASVTGTRRDPQDKPRVVQSLREAGAHVLPSNAAASRLAGFIARQLAARP